MSITTVSAIHSTTIVSAIHSIAIVLAHSNKVTLLYRNVGIDADGIWQAMQSFALHCLLTLHLKTQDNITQTRPCNILQYFTAVKMIIFK